MKSAAALKSTPDRNCVTEEMVTPTKTLSRKRKLEPSLLKNSMLCSRCSKEFGVEVTSTSNIKGECIGCLSKPKKEVGGYSLNMTDEQQLQKDFQCPICLLIIRDSTELPCNHLMCKSCLVQNEHYLMQSKGVLPPCCSLCKASYDPKKKSAVKSIDKIILTSLKVKCIQTECSWVGCIQDFEAHKAKCEYVLVACSHDKCPTRIQQKEQLINSHKERCIYRSTMCRYCAKSYMFFQMETHYAECPHYTIKCPNQNCQTKMKRNQVKWHQVNQCLYETIDCPFESFGCKFRGERGSIEGHRETERSNHETLLLTTIANMKGEMNKMNGEIQTLKSHSQRSSLRSSALHFRRLTDRISRYTVLEELPERVEGYQTINRRRKDLKKRQTPPKKEEQGDSNVEF